MDDRCDDDDVFGCAVGGGRRRDGGGRPGGEKRRQATMVHEVALATKMIVRMLGDAGDEGIFPLVTEEQVLKWMVHVHLGFPTDSYQCSEVCSSFSCDVDKVCATPIGEMYHSYWSIFGEDIQKISHPFCRNDRDVLVSFLALLRVAVWEREICTGKSEGGWRKMDNAASSGRRRLSVSICRGI
jgi:hypothetical protein